MVDRLDYQRASHDVYNRKAVGLLALQAAASTPVAPTVTAAVPHLPREASARRGWQGGDGTDEAAAGGGEGCGRRRGGGAEEMQHLSIANSY